FAGAACPLLKSDGLTPATLEWSHASRENQTIFPRRSFTIFASEPGHSASSLPHLAQRARTGNTVRQRCVLVSCAAAYLMRPEVQSDTRSQKSCPFNSVNPSALNR